MPDGSKGRSALTDRPFPVFDQRSRSQEFRDSSASPGRAAAHAPQRQPVFHAGQLQMRLRLEQALERSRLFHGFKGFDDVPDLDVVEILEAHAAFHALGHFPGVIL